MTDSAWREMSAARLPAAHLAALAAVRDQTDVRAHRDESAVWLQWTPGRLDLVRRLLPVPGVEFFGQRGGLWYRFGSRVPTSTTPPDGAGQLLAGILVPARFDPVPSVPASGPRVKLRVVRGGSPNPATAMDCSLTELRRWSDTATTAEMAAVRGARSGERAVLLGNRLPAVPGAKRLWGDSLLVPVGFRPDPELPPALLRAAIGAESDELVILAEDGADVIPLHAFAQLSRAGVRLAITDTEGRSAS